MASTDPKLMRQQFRKSQKIRPEDQQVYDPFEAERNQFNPWILVPLYCILFAVASLIMFFHAVCQFIGAFEF